MRRDPLGIAGARIIVVEDEALIAEELRDRLTRLGASVLSTVSTAEAALDDARRLEPDMVMLDIRLKGALDGIEAAERLRGAVDTAIVFLTAHADAATLDRAKRVNPAGYLLKPIDDRLLRLVLELALYRHVFGRRLLEAQKLEAVGRIAGGMAHDINNLMTIVTGFSEVLLAAETNCDTRRKLEKIHRAGERSAHLTRQLLAFSRQLMLSPHAFDLGAFVASLQTDMHEIVGPTVEIGVRQPSAACPAFADAAQLRAVILSLVDNAARAMPGGGLIAVDVCEEVLAADSPEVTFDALPSARYACVSVEDSGAGMPEDVRARVFEPFFRPKPFDRTTGISLAAAYGIVRQSGGTMRVSSAPGRGTRVDVLVPRTSDA